MTKHTKGPWHHTGKEFNDVRDGDDELVAVALHLRVGRPERSINEASANARLIASAPDLLEALQAAVNCGMVPITSAHEGGAAKHSIQVCVADQIRAAIAKATGQEA